jgi:diaminopimelate decarboxylase
VLAGMKLMLQLKQRGFDPCRVVFAGVGKSDNEIINAIKADIFCFNCESIPEWK